MIDTTVLQPPCEGPRSNPLLFGVAEALTALIPLTDRTRPGATAAPRRDDDRRAEHEATTPAS